MKKIGHVDGATSDPVWRTHPLGMLAPHDLFIPNPGERENIDAEAFEHVGWVNPDADGGVICGNHATVGDNGRPAYVRRVQIGGPVSQDVVTAAPTPFKRIVGPSIQSKISTDELISEALEFCDTELGGWDGVDVETGCERAGVYIRELVRRLQSPSSTTTDGLGSVVHEPPMSFYDHAFLTSFSMQSAHIPMSDALTRSHDVARQLDRDRKSRT